MCEICSGDTHDRLMAMKAQKSFASRLRRLAEKFDDLGNGVIEPHTKDAELISMSARSAIRELSKWI